MHRTVTAGQLRIHVDGHIDPRVCARLSDSGAVSSGDSLLVMLLAERARDCADSSGGFRHTLLIAGQQTRTLTIVASGRLQRPAKTLVLRLPIEP